MIRHVHPFNQHILLIVLKAYSSIGVSVGLCALQNLVPRYTARGMSGDSVAVEFDHENGRILELSIDVKGRRLEIIDIEVDHSNIDEGSIYFVEVVSIFNLPN